MATETIERLVEKFRANRQRFEPFCRALSEEELSRPVPDSTWAVKDFVSHLGSLDTELVRWFDGLREGRLDENARLADGSAFDIDKWNDERIAERREWPLERILTEAAGNREAFLQTLEKLEDKHIEQVFHFRGDNKRDPADIQFKLFLLGLARHDPIHVADMVKALPERAEDPDLKSWLDDSVVQWYQTVMAGPAKR